MATITTSNGLYFKRGRLKDMTIELSKVDDPMGAHLRFKTEHGDMLVELMAEERHDILMWLYAQHSQRHK